MEKEKKYIHFQQKHTLKTWVLDNNSPAENVQNMYGECKRDRDEVYMNIQQKYTYTQNIRQDNNSPTKNVHDTMSEIVIG